MTPQPPERTPPAHLTARPILRVATPEQKGETLPLGPVLFSYTTRKPLGVAGAIIPWNSPLVLAAVAAEMENARV